MSKSIDETFERLILQNKTRKWFIFCISILVTLNLIDFLFIVLSEKKVFSRILIPKQHRKSINSNHFAIKFFDILEDCLVRVFIFTFLGGNARIFTQPFFESFRRSQHQKTNNNQKKDLLHSWTDCSEERANTAMIKARNLVLVDICKFKDKCEVPVHVEGRSLLARDRVHVWKRQLTFWKRQLKF